MIDLLSLEPFYKKVTLMIKKQYFLWCCFELQFSPFLFYRLCRNFEKSHCTLFPTSTEPLCCHVHNPPVLTKCCSHFFFTRNSDHIVSIPALWSRVKCGSLTVLFVIKVLAVQRQTPQKINKENLLVESTAILLVIAVWYRTSSSAC